MQVPCAIVPSVLLQPPHQQNHKYFGFKSTFFISGCQESCFNAIRAEINVPTFSCVIVIGRVSMSHHVSTIKKKIINILSILAGAGTCGVTLSYLSVTSHNIGKYINNNAVRFIKSATMYVVRNARCAQSRYTLKLSLFL